MKTKKHLLIIFGIILVLSCVLVSCQTSKKAALACPEFSITKNNKVAVVHKRNKAFTAHYRAKTRKQPARLSVKKPRRDNIVFKNFPVKDAFIVTASEKVSGINKIEYSRGLTASVNNAFIPFVMNNTSALSINKLDVPLQPKDLIITQQSECDTIVLRSGSLLIGKVVELAQNEIKYRKCNFLTGPIISILKSDVAVIIYSNGAHDFIPSPDAFIPNQNNLTPRYNNIPLKTEGLAIAGFVSSLVGLFIAGIILGLIGVVFGGISLGKIKRNPNFFKGKGLAIASIIIGIISFVGAIIVVSAM